MNTLNVQTTPHSIQTVSQSQSRTLPMYIPDNAQSMVIEKYTEPGSIVTGYYKVTITTTTGQSTTSIVDGQTMVLMMGAFISRKVEGEFVNLFNELEKRNSTIHAIQQLMPIIVNLQLTVPPSGVHTLTGQDSLTWERYASQAGLPREHQDSNFTAADVTKVIDLLQTNLGNQTRAGEQQMMKLNTQASLRSTVYGMMQSNASAFKQALQNAANG